MRLLIEILAIVAVAQVIVMLALPSVAADLTAQGRTFLSAALLVLLAGPTVYWRCMAGPRPASSVSTDKASRNSSVKSAIVMTAAAQALGLALTGVCVVWQQRSIAAAAQGKFDRGAERIEAEVRRHFTLPLYGLNGPRGMFAAVGPITRNQFRTWVDSRNLPTEFPGVRGFGFIERVQRDDVPRFVGQQRADGIPDFELDSTGTASDLYLVKYVEPIASNRAGLGKDVGPDSVRRDAVERAVHTGLPALSGRLTLAQDIKQGPAFLLFLPVYQAGKTAASLATPDQRQSMLVGLLYAPIVASEIMQGVGDVAEGELHVEWFDGDSSRPGDLMFDSQTDASASAAAAGHAHQSVRTFVVGGRTLALRTTSTPAFEALIDRSSLVFVAVGGVLASFVMALAVWLLAVGRVRAQRRAQRMTADLARLARVAQHTSNAVSITDAQMHINWVNDGFTRVTGYTLEEAAGKTPGELLGSGKADPAVIKKLLDAVAAGEVCRVEVL